MLWLWNRNSGRNLADYKMDLMKKSMESNTKKEISCEFPFGTWGWIMVAKLQKKKLTKCLHSLTRAQDRMCCTSASTGLSVAQQLRAERKTGSDAVIFMLPSERPCQCVPLSRVCAWFTAAVVSRWCGPNYNWDMEIDAVICTLPSSRSHALEFFWDFLTRRLLCRKYSQIVFPYHVSFNRL